MRNVNMSIKGDILTITVNLKEKGELSASGKSDVISTTEGAVSVTGREDVKLNINVYRPVKAGKSLKAA